MILPFSSPPLSILVDKSALHLPFFLILLQTRRVISKSLPLRFYAPTLCRVDLCYLVQTTLTAPHSCCPSLTSSHLSPRLSPVRSPPRSSHLVYDDHLQVFRPVTLMSIGGPQGVPRAWYLRDEHHVTTLGQCYPNDLAWTEDQLQTCFCGWSAVRICVNYGFY